MLACAADQSVSKSERDRLTLAYQQQAVESMKSAVEGGYHDERDLNTSPTYAPLRGRDDFADLVRGLTLRAQDYGSE